MLPLIVAAAADSSSPLVVAPRGRRGSSPSPPRLAVVAAAHRRRRPAAPMLRFDRLSCRDAEPGRKRLNQIAAEEPGRAPAAIPRALYRLALPVLASQVLRLGYQWVDALWVRGLGVE